jgi:uncharacterized protein YprB with RNaseH-like and TPR domain
MLTQDVLQRLSALNRTRGTAPEIGEPAGGHSVPDASVPHHPEAETSLDQIPVETGHADVSQLPPGDEMANPWGKHWQRNQLLTELWPHGEEWLSRELVRLDALAGQHGKRARELQALLDHLPSQVVFLDLETCGFAGSPIFLAGLIHEQQGQWTLTQLLARNYAEEKPLLQTLWNIAARKCVLVTFNGKTFDWPMVHDRSTVHHLGQDRRNFPDEPRMVVSDNGDAPGWQRHDPRPNLLHCDLLHHARRKWGRRLPDCRLQTLERHLCRRQRTDDIPGREIPAAYHDFVRDGDAWLLRGVLHHNALDLITLLQVAMLAVS